MSRKKNGSAWPLEDVSPCFQLGRMVTEIKCNLESGARHLRHGDENSGRLSLVGVEATAKELARAFPKAKAKADKLRKEVDAITSKLKNRKLSKKDREDLARKAGAVRPDVSDLFVQGTKFCRV